MAASEKPEKTAYVYMVRCAGGQLYTGWTNDPEARLKAHQSGKGAKYTRTHTALGFAYLEACADKSAALRREIALKKLTKAQKETLCAGWTADRMYKPDCIRPCIYKLRMHKICIYLENNA